MSTYNDNLTLQAKQLSQADVDAAGGTITLCRAGIGPVIYPVVAGDFFCTRWVGVAHDQWILPYGAFSVSGWFPVSPPDDLGFVIYGGLHTCTVIDLDNGFFECSSGCLVDDDTFAASHTLNTP